LKVNEYNVYENEKLMATVNAKTASAAIKKVERGHCYLFNAFAVNTQDASDSEGVAIDPRHAHPE